MKKERIVISGLIFILIVVVMVSGCTLNQLTGNTVTMQNMTFNPSLLNVKVGTTVSWINKDSVTHHVISDSGLFVSGNLTNGMSYNYTFNQTGSYPYHCSTHPSMNGTIIVSLKATTSTTQY